MKSNQTVFSFITLMWSHKDGSTCTRLAVLYQMLIVRNPSFPNECIYFQNGSTYWKRGALVFKFVSVESGQVFFPVCSKFTVISNVSPSPGNVTLFFKGNYRHCAEKKNKTISQCRIETCLLTWKVSSNSTITEHWINFRCGDSGGGGGS